MILTCGDGKLEAVSIQTSLLRRYDGSLRILSRQMLRRDQSLLIALYVKGCQQFILNSSALLSCRGLQRALEPQCWILLVLTDGVLSDTVLELECSAVDQMFFMKNAAYARFTCAKLFTSLGHALFFALSRHRPDRGRVLTLSRQMLRIKRAWLNLLPLLVIEDDAHLVLCRDNSTRLLSLACATYSTRFLLFGLVCNSGEALEIQTHLSLQELLGQVWNG